MRGAVYIISGVPGTGKSSVSEALMRRFSRSIHLSVDELRGCVVRDYADPTQLWTDETELQFRLARESVADVARRYSEGGFAVAIDDVIWPHEVDTVIAPLLGDRPVRGVLLHAPLDVILHRNATRTNKHFDTTVLEDTIRMLHERMKPDPEQWPGWLLLDTSEMTLPQTVDAILTRASSFPDSIP